MQAIDAITNKVIATVPVGQLPQALVYVPGTPASPATTLNLKLLGAGECRTHTDASCRKRFESSRSVLITSLGLIDNLQIAATGLEPGKNYRLVLVGKSESRDLLKLIAGVGGVAIVQALGPLKHAVTGSSDLLPMKLELRLEETGGVVLLQLE